GADPSDGRDELRQGVRAATVAGWRVLSAGGAALDAVESAVRALEDDPRFNAGRGSVLTRDGTVEMDASIMEGDRLQCGAVGAVSRIANPVSLARSVLEARRHVLLVGDGALIGCGTYADSSIGGVSCTGDGEAIIRVGLGHHALHYLKDADDPDYAAKVAVDLLVEEGRGQGGLILIDWRGRAGYATSTR